jgi:5-hydroxyisourate hydrolase
VSISTHVLDAMTGRPAAGLELVLSQRAPGQPAPGQRAPGQPAPGQPAAGGWQDLTSRATDADGRVSDLAGDVAAGVYRIVFQTEAYFAAAHAGVETFYPEVAVVFQVKDPAARHHVPLLLSPFAYSTYRGS